MSAFIFTPASQTAPCHLPLTIRIQDPVSENAVQYSYTDKDDKDFEINIIVRICQQRGIPRPEGFTDDAVFVLSLNMHEGYRGETKLLCLTRSKDIFASNGALRRFKEMSAQKLSSIGWTKFIGLTD